MGLALARILSGVLVGIYCLLFVAPHARAEPAIKAVVMVQTVPQLAGIRFTLDGRSFVSDDHGLALITVADTGRHVLGLDPPERLKGDMRLAFEGWSDGTTSARRDITLESFTFLEAGFNSSYLWNPSFIDRQGDRLGTAKIDSVTVVDDLGNRFVLQADEPWWLPGSRIMTPRARFHSEKITYRLGKVATHETDVEASTHEPFFPGSSKPVILAGPAFPSVHIRVRDALFGSPISGSVLIRYPDGQIQRHPLDRQGTLELASLSRGNYTLTLDAPGLSRSRPFLMYHRQELQLLVVSYVDIAVAALVLLAAAGATVLRRLL